MSLEFHYFDLKGRGELTRLILAAAGKSYKEQRVALEEWPVNPTLKENAPIGQLPYLKVDNVKIPQSIAIARYLSREFNLSGKNSLEQAQADAIVDTVLDGYNIYISKYERHQAYRRFSEANEGANSFFAIDFHKQFGNIEKLIQLYGQNGYSVGETLTWADLAIYDFYSQLIEQFEDLVSFNAFPNVQNVVNSVLAQPNILSYVKTRPGRQI